MSVRLYNTLTRRVEEFIPRTPPHVDMFVCGPTVYDLVHIGNARTFTVFDTVAKWLRYRDFSVSYLQNITDVDDKIIRRAAEQNRKPLELAEHYYGEFAADMRSLGNDAVDRYVRATEHIPQVITQVKKLIAKGNAYLIPGDGWYFDLSTFADYGKLSGRTSLAAEDAVSRIDENERKRNVGDFCLWKLSKPGEPTWEDDELGAGRPGWHIEDTAMTEHHFGPQYDLHGGGNDLMFPHHEAEIAQQEAASGKVPFVRHWMHSGFLQLSGGKMSKSVGNIITLRDALARWSAPALRFFFLSGHWRAPLELSDSALDSAAAAVQRIAEVRHKIRAFRTDSARTSFENDFRSADDAIGRAMDDDLNTPRAFAALFELIGELNRRIADEGITEHDAAHAETFFTFIQRQFGFVPSDITAPADIERMAHEREDARGRKDWALADTIRVRLQELGWSIDDTPYGPLLKKI